MAYETKEEAMKHISTTNSKVTAKQTEMINLMYDYEMKVTQNDLDNIALDAHKDAMRKVMSY
jgi:Fe2+ or Zn2+ uptake regulation protein